MAISVRMMPLLAKRARSRSTQFDVPYRAGLTVATILAGEGFSDADQDAITVMVNDAQAEAAQPLSDGDRVELLVGIQGG